MCRHKFDCAFTGSLLDGASAADVVCAAADRRADVLNAAREATADVRCYPRHGAPAAAAALWEGVKMEGVG